MNLSKYILKSIGWKITNILPDVSKCVIAVAPHTSNLDFIIGKLAYNSLNRKAKFLMKKEWFFFPLNIILKSLGGIPINRTKKQSMTDVISKEFEKRKKLQIAVTPEGTRKLIKEWKKGFYYIAVKAKIPILLIGLNYTKKEVVFIKLFHPTGDYESDIKIIKSYYTNFEGRHKDRFSI